LIKLYSGTITELKILQPNPLTTPPNSLTPIKT
jgi:hypothetical protein